MQKKWRRNMKCVCGWFKTWCVDYFSGNWMRVQDDIYSSNFSLRAMASRTRICNYSPSSLRDITYLLRDIVHNDSPSTRWKMTEHLRVERSCQDTDATDTSHEVEEYEMESSPRAEFFMVNVNSSAKHFSGDFSTYFMIARRSMLKAVCSFWIYLAIICPV